MDAGHLFKGLRFDSTVEQPLICIIVFLFIYISSTFRPLWPQNVDDARRLLKYVDEDLGKPLPEKDYGGNCLLYDPDKPDDPYHNLWVSD